jgi:large subunit ribosomal protein L29
LVKKVAIIKKRQLKEMSRPDLLNRMNDLKLELVKERGQIALGGSPASPGRIREIRKTIARILVELKMRGEK